jgi:hypothetical protein
MIYLVDPKELIKLEACTKFCHIKPLYGIII